MKLHTLFEVVIASISIIWKLNSIRKAIKEKNKENIKAEMFFLLIIILIAAALFIF